MSRDSHAQNKERDRRFVKDMQEKERRAAQSCNVMKRLCWGGQGSSGVPSSGQTKRSLVHVC